MENSSSNEIEEEKQENTENNTQNSNNENKKEENKNTSTEKVTENKTLNEKKYVSVETLNFRTEPNSNSKVISVLKVNSEVIVIEKTDNEWSKINYKDTIGYVASKYLSDKKVENTSRSEVQVRETKKEENQTNSSTNNQDTENKKEVANSKVSETTEVKETQEKKNETSNASSTSTNNTTSTSNNNTSSSSKGAEVAAYAKQFLGNPYVYGGTSLTNGCDCSGFVMSVYAHFGYSLPHGSNPIATKGVAVSKANLQPGDVVIFTGHCGIYIGGNEFIHAQSSATGIVITSLSSSYYSSRYQGARRIIN